MKDKINYLSFSHRRAPYIWLAVLLILLVLITIPRFNRQDLWFIDNFTTDGLPAASSVVLADAGSYIAHVEYLRGEPASENLKSPFVYRPLVPLVASILPFEPMTAINVVNLLFLIAGLVFLWATLARMVRVSLQVLGGFLYTVSFGTFFYGTIGYIDASAVGIITISSYFIVSSRWLPLLVALTVGPFIKEQVLVLSPALLGYMRFSIRHTWIKSLAISGASGIYMVVLLYIARVISPIDMNSAGLSLANILNNWPVSISALLKIQEAEEVLKLFLGFGAPALLFVLLLWPTRHNLNKSLPIIAPFLGGAIGVTIFVIYAQFCCATAGRFSWMTAPFLIPITMYLLETLFRDKENQGVEKERGSSEGMMTITSPSI